MDWAARRKLLYAIVVLGIIVIALVIFFQKTFTAEPSCFDRRKNGDETGRDCGGSCALYCRNAFPDPKVRWKRSFVITPNFAHAIAYVEHNSQNAGLRSLRYRFNLLDESGELIASKEGTTFIGGPGVTAIIEPLIPIEGKNPMITEFEILDSGQWEKVPPGTTGVLVKTLKTTLDDAEPNETKLSADLQNQLGAVLFDVSVTAILYDADGNAITISRTEVPRLDPLAKTTVYFTWPFPVTERVARIEVIPRVDPFKNIAQ